MIEQIKELRVKIDGYAQLTKELKPIGDSHSMGMTEEEKKKFYKYKNSKEIDKAVDSLYLGKAWLGKLLGELGTANPYTPKKVYRHRHTNICIPVEKLQQEIRNPLHHLYQAKEEEFDLINVSDYKTKEDIVLTQDVSKVQIKFPYKKYYKSEDNLWFDENRNFVGIEVFINGGVYGQYLRDGSFEEREDIVSVELNHIEKVDWLRTEIESLILVVKDIDKDIPYENKVAFLSLHKSFTYKELCEAKMWLGFELERIKNEK